MIRVALLVAVLLMNAEVGHTEELRSYVMPENGRPILLFQQADGDLVVDGEIWRGTTRVPFLWDADREVFLPEVHAHVDPNDLDAFWRVYREAGLTHLDRIGLMRDRSAPVGNGSELSAKFLKPLPHCEWPYPNYLRVQRADGTDVSFSIMARIRPESVYVGPKCGTALRYMTATTKLRESLDTRWERPGGGFYVTVLNYVIAFDSDGKTSFSWSKTPLVLVPEAAMTDAFHGLETGQMTPQEAIDSLPGNR